MKRITFMRLIPELSLTYGIMTLHRKTIIIISTTLGILIVVLYISSRFILLRSFDKLEKKEVVLNVQRVLNTLNNDLAVLSSTTADWASWDETYRFIEDNNPGYRESNLVDSTFIELKLNLIMFVNSAGRIIFSRAFDLEEEKEVPVPDDVFDHLSSHDLLMHHADAESSVRGIVLFAGGPVLVASRPILSSNDKGPVRGALIMGRFLDSHVTERLSDTTQLSLAVDILSEGGTPSDTGLSGSSFSEEMPVIIRPLNRETIMGHAMVRDIYGDPALLLSIDMARNIYKQGQASVNYFVLSLFVAGLMFGIVTRLLLEKQVLLRLALFSKSIVDIGRKKDLSARVSMTGDDELSDLAKEFNKMIEALEQSEKKLFVANSELEVKIQTLRNEIAEREKLEKDREKLITELKEAIAKVKTLKGLLPICASCNKIRDEKGDWTHVDVYIRDHSDAEITHGYCPECARKYFPRNYEDRD